MTEQNRPRAGHRLRHIAIMLGSALFLSACALPAPFGAPGTGPTVGFATAHSGAVDALPALPGTGNFFSRSSWGNAADALPAVSAVWDERPAPGAAPVGSTSYPIADGALFVSGAGSDRGSGTRHSPLKTIKAAVARARSGQTIVLRQGSYAEEVKIPATKTITLQPFPGEAVWLDGSVPVSGFEPDGGAFVVDGWTAEFDASPTYSWGAEDGTTPGWAFVNPDHPMAAHPDQVWIDGVAQRQVGSLDDLEADSFLVDYADDRLFLGTDPSGKSVRASALAKAISIQSAGSAVKGIGVRRFSPSVPHMAAVTVENSGIVIENVVVKETSTTGLAVSGVDVSLRGITLTENGMLGASATYADGLTAVDLEVTHNNTEGFNRSPAAGGFKIGRTRTVQVRDSTFRQNDGTGLWFDESVSDATAAGNDIIGNAGHGISVEISARAVIADNVIAANDGHGLKVNNSSDVEIWNNSLVDNGRPINIVQDERRSADRDTPGHDPRRQWPDPSMTWINGPVTIRNNVITGTTANCLLCVEDYAHELSAEAMGVTSSGNVFHRSSGSSPAWLVIWSRAADDPAVFTTLGRFRSATGQSTHDMELTGDAIADPMSFRISETVRSAVVAQPLTDRISSLMGLAPGTLLVGAARD